MNENIRNRYLETEVQTATPQKLQKMLLDGAVRFALAAQKSSEEGALEQAQGDFGRCRDIVSELLAGIRGDDELSSKVTGLYSFILRTLIEIQQTYDDVKMNDIIELLEIERETWRLLCEKMPEAPAPDAERKSAASEISAQQATNILDNARVDNGYAPPTQPMSHGTTSPGGFSIDA